jgi:hypothetical protein
MPNIIRLKLQAIQKIGGVANYINAIVLLRLHNTCKYSAALKSETDSCPGSTKTVYGRWFSNLSGSSRNSGKFSMESEIVRDMGTELL